MTHTPGPWIAVRSPSSGWRVQAAKPPDAYKSGKPYRNVAGKVHEADAHLIAAAPDLLEALSALLMAPWDPTSLGGGNTYMQAVEQARAAITKATVSIL